MKNKKPYFTKYIPVEGEIKVNDMTHNGTGVGPFYKGMSKEGHIKVKLFLCSRDIKLYDEVYNPEIDKFETVIKDLYEGGGKRPDNTTDFQEVEQCKSFKVIGEISPSALLYVKEGQEFGEEKLAFGTALARDFSQEFSEIINFEPALKMCKTGDWFIKIKGPCGHFH